MIWIQVTSWSCVSRSSTGWVSFSMSSLTAMATPPPSCLFFFSPVCHSLYPGILGGVHLVSVRHMTCAFFVSAAFSMLLILFLAPFALQYSTLRQDKMFLFLFLFLLWIWWFLLPLRFFCWGLLSTPRVGLGVSVVSVGSFVEWNQ